MTNSIDFNKVKILNGIIFFDTAVFILVVIWFSTNIILRLQKQSMELEGLNVKLNKKVEKRTKELKKSNELKDLFIFIMNHDLKNPITSIKGYSQLIKSTTKEKKTKSFSHKIIDDSNRMNELITEARLFSQIKSGEYKEKKEMVDINKMINDIIPEFQIKLKSKGMKIDLKMKKSKVYNLYILPILKEVFLNLIDNAIKYSPKKTKIVIDIKKKENNILISFFDQGDGIKYENKELIFQKFQRAEAKKAIEGSGLGLSITKQIVELHNGKIWVEDNIPKGSVFIVKIPIKK